MLVMNPTTRVLASATSRRTRTVAGGATPATAWRADVVLWRRHRAFETTSHLSRWGGATYSAQQESLAGSLNLEIATIFSASAIAGNTWSRSIKSGIVARYFMAIAAS